MRTWIVVDWESNTHIISAYTESEAIEKAYELTSGNLLSFEEQ